MTNINVTATETAYYPTVMRSTCSYKTIEVEMPTSDYLTITPDGTPDEYKFTSENDYGEPMYYQCTDCDLGAESFDDPILQRHLERSV